MYPKHEQQLHFDVRSSCGSSLVGVNVHNVAVAQVLGMSDSANTFEVIIIQFLDFGEYRTSDMCIKHMQKCVLCFQATVLHVLYNHAPF